MKFFKFFNYSSIVQDLKQKPASHLFSFLFLHEVTAIVPIPVLFVTMRHYQLELPFEYTKSVNRNANTQISKVLEYFGLEPLSPDSKDFQYVISTYLIVKLLMPLRLAMSLYYTPGLVKLLNRLL